MAARCAREIPPGSFVNLGIGTPTLVAARVPPGRGVMFMSENGVLGVGPRPAKGEEHPDYINASREPITLLPGASLFHHADSFAMIRGGHIDIAVMGALQVSAEGDLANWTIPGEAFGGIGGAMDLAAGAKAVFVLMSHTTREGEPKILNACIYPLTARRVVKKVFTDLAFIEVTERGLLLREVAPGVSPEEVQRLTEPPLLRVEPPGAMRP
ncbi:MAG: 3-oxoacid CoA-transferase subunit B [Nitrospinota bacterium]